MSFIPTPPDATAKMMEIQRRQVQSQEKIKELEELLKEKEKELAVARMMNDTLIDKLTQAGARQVGKGAGAPALTVGQEGDKGDWEKLLGTLKKGLVDVNQRLQRLEEAKTSVVAAITQVPAASSPSTYLKFCFNPRSQATSTTAYMTTDCYDEYKCGRLCRWQDICSPEQIKILSFRHGITFFPVLGGISTVPKLGLPSDSSSSRNLLKFDPPFDSPPTVVIWFTGVEMNLERSCRVRCRAEDVTANDFTAVVESWDAADLYKAGVAWVAYEKRKAGVWSDTWIVAEKGWMCPIVHWSGPQEIHMSFELLPTTMVAVNEIVAASVDKGFGYEVKMDASKRVINNGKLESYMRWSVEPENEKLWRLGCVGLALGGEVFKEA